MNNLKLFLLVPVFFGLVQCKSTKTHQLERKNTVHVQINDTLLLDASLIFFDNFDTGLSDWVAEHEREMHLSVVDGKMDIDAPMGSTTWFREKLEAPLMIEYDIEIIKMDGPNDRVSDLNCFWLATDPSNRDDFFKESVNRKGIFSNYDHMKLYYVGLGGHNNTRTRFRRYDGTGEKPLLAGHDLSDELYLITPNEVNSIRIIVYKNIVQYYRNGLLIFDFYDEFPHKEGYFGIRTVRNHLTVDNFKVYSLRNER
jgi:hypothetical protein